MSALADYRTDRFKQRQLTLVVTPSEYNLFDLYCDRLGFGLDVGYVPDPIQQGHACLFYRMANGDVTWHDPEDLNVPDDMPAARIPFALLEYGKLNTRLDTLDFIVEIQSRLRSIENDIQFIHKALEAFDKITHAS